MIQLLQKYTLGPDGATPQAENDIIAWAMWMTQHRPNVMHTLIGWPTYSYMYSLSTVFLGIDHNYFNDESDPILWETMIFRCDGRFRRQPWPTWQPRPKLQRSYKRPVDALQFADHQKRYTSLADAVAGHVALEARVFQTLKRLRPTNVPPKFRPAFISRPALKLLTGDMRAD